MTTAFQNVTSEQYYYYRGILLLYHVVHGYLLQVHLYSSVLYMNYRTYCTVHINCHYSTVQYGQQSFEVENRDEFAIRLLIGYLDGNWNAGTVPYIAQL